MTNVGDCMICPHAMLQQWDSYLSMVVRLQVNNVNISCFS